jgi:hypothetical protein
MLIHVCNVSGRGLRQLSRYSEGLKAGRTGYNFDKNNTFSLLHSVQSSFAIHPTSNANSTEDFSRGVKWPGHNADSLP